MANRRRRKTTDCWRFFVQYGRGIWSLEHISYSEQDINAFRDAYLQWCNYPWKIVRGRERKDAFALEVAADPDHTVKTK